MAVETWTGADASRRWWMGTQQPTGMQTRRGARRPLEPSTVEKYKVQPPCSPWSGVPLASVQFKKSGAMCSRMRMAMSDSSADPS